MSEVPSVGEDQVLTTEGVSAAWVGPVPKAPSHIYREHQHHFHISREKEAVLRFLKVTSIFLSYDPSSDC